MTVGQQVRGRRLAIGQQSRGAEERAADGEGVRPADAQDADAARTARRGNGSDGVSVGGCARYRRHGAIVSQETLLRYRDRSAWFPPGGSRAFAERPYEPDG